MVSAPSGAGSGTLYALLRLWKKWQVSYYGGKYSIERLLSLEAFQRTSSFSRVLLVCIGAPAPMITVVVIEEMIPLQDPEAGWRANYSFWIRAAVLAFVVSQSITGQARYFVNGANFSEQRLAVLSACVSVVFNICAMGISNYLIFPIPFFVLTMAPMFYAILIVLFRIIMGVRICREMLAHSDQLVRYVVFVCAQITVAFIYPSYESLFRFVAGTRCQFAVILLLPVIKVAVKNMILRCTAYMEDMAPEAVIFTVDLFNAIYVATCMQSTSSAIAVTAISVTDLVQTSVMLYGLHRRTATIRPKLSRVLDTNSERDNVVNMASLVCKDLEKFKNQNRADIRIRSCLPHLITPVDSIQLHTLESVRNESQHVVGTTYHTKRRNFGSFWPLVSMTTIRPIVPSTETTVHVEKKRQILHVCSTHSTVLRETLETLFTVECIVVTAYLEAVVPLFYSCYMLLMVHLQSAQYHTEMAGISRENVGGTVLPLFIFAMLQLVSFLLFAFVIKRNCGMQALYQLAFVLETQMSLIQGKMMLWMVITFCFRVVHFGMDFTFQFDWIRDKRNSS